eukprot:TRINITY_DN1541_c0_g1_i3.p1 TRINITY_DN1541_c0_g1~~TRINITY_DN1541_c0_g1_i3.p1  ORF type:complete len:824 (-),score=93.19 TRINITY_DN1541_c0_g1_i3:1093-3564(-)
MRSAASADYFKQGLAKRCPICSVWIEKNGGCDHITCLVCGSDWCWSCGRNWPPCKQQHLWRTATPRIEGESFDGWEDNTRLGPKIAELKAENAMIERMVASRAVERGGGGTSFINWKEACRREHPDWARQMEENELEIKRLTDIELTRQICMEHARRIRMDHARRIEQVTDFIDRNIACGHFDQMLLGCDRVGEYASSVPPLRSGPAFISRADARAAFRRLEVDAQLCLHDMKTKVLVAHTAADIRVSRALVARERADFVEDAANQAVAVDPRLDRSVAVLAAKILDFDGTKLEPRAIIAAVSMPSGCHRVHHSAEEMKEKARERGIHTAEAGAESDLALADQYVVAVRLLCAAGEAGNQRASREQAGLAKLHSELSIGLRTLVSVAVFRWKSSGVSGGVASLAAALLGAGCVTSMEADARSLVEDEQTQVISKQNKEWDMSLRRLQHLQLARAQVSTALGHDLSDPVASSTVGKIRKWCAYGRQQLDRRFAQVAAAAVAEDAALDPVVAFFAAHSFALFYKQEPTVADVKAQALGGTRPPMYRRRELLAAEVNYSLNTRLAEYSHAVAAFAWPLVQGSDPQLVEEKMLPVWEVVAAFENPAEGFSLSNIAPPAPHVIARALVHLNVIPCVEALLRGWIVSDEAAARAAVLDGEKQENPLQRFITSEVFQRALVEDDWAHGFAAIVQLKEEIEQMRRAQVKGLCDSESSERALVEDDWAHGFAAIVQLKEEIEQMRRAQVKGLCDSESSERALVEDDWARGFAAIVQLKENVKKAWQYFLRRLPQLLVEESHARTAIEQEVDAASVTFKKKAWKLMQNARFGG